MCSPLVKHLAQPKAKFCSFQQHGSCRISGCASAAVTSNSGWTSEPVTAPGCAEKSLPKSIPIARPKMCMLHVTWQ